MLRTKLFDIPGIEYPILSAGMGPTLIGENTGIKNIKEEQPCKR